MMTEPNNQNPKTTILVVEDDMYLMEGIREILELDHYKVITASSGVEGLEVLRELPAVPDLIVSDIMMPQMDGYKFFEAVRAEPDWVAIPFIFLTAKGEKSDIRLGKSMGADDYVTKPFGAEDLLVAVSSKLARREQLLSVFSSQVSDLKRRILTILNHEFRTPLTYVVAYADMLNRDADHLAFDELRDFLHGINSGAERLRRLIENFIFLVELETGEVALTFAWRKTKYAHYENLVALAIKHEQHMLDATEQTVNVTIDPNTPPLLGDEEFLVGALARLIDNASKFSPKGAQIHITIAPASHNPQSCTITVRDNGRGIPAHEIPQIFDMFYQINRQQFEDQGSGSGLAIVKGIVQVHHAEIYVDSEMGTGSTFRLEFPPYQE